MFPYRRNGGKKRGKGGPAGPPGPHQQQQRHRDHGGGGGNGRRVPGSAAEMLAMLQPTTKALAQMLAGNARASGQIAHARSVMVYAHRLVEERAVDRLPPAHREEFLEQLARLKLTLTDAEEAAEAAESEPAAAARPALDLGPDRLREVARRLAISSTPVAEPPAAEVDDPEPEPEEEPEPEPEIPAATAARGERIRLRLSSDADAPAPVRARDRVRLKPVAKPAAGPSSGG